MTLAKFCLNKVTFTSYGFRFNNKKQLEAEVRRNFYHALNKLSTATSKADKVGHICSITGHKVTAVVRPPPPSPTTTRSSSSIAPPTPSSKTTHVAADPIQTLLKLIIEREVELYNNLSKFKHGHLFFMGIMRNPGRGITPAATSHELLLKETPTDDDMLNMFIVSFPPSCMSPSDLGMHKTGGVIPPNSNCHYWNNHTAI